MSHYVNAHDHLSFYADWQEAVRVIEERQIHTLFVSETPEQYDAYKAWLPDHPLIKWGFGIHPWQVRQVTYLGGLEKYIAQCDFIGEIGLDTVWAPPSARLVDQLRVFEYFLTQIKQTGKIASIHTKGAEDIVLSLLQKYGLSGQMIHWYSGPLSLVADYLALDCYFTISVDLGYRREAERLVEILPLDRILTETDGPTSLEWVNGQLSQPDYVAVLVEQIARIKQLPVQVVKQAIWENYLRIWDK